jgi:hypothetical protein
MSDYITIGQRILLTLWVGALWAIGYIAAPVLFSVIFDRFVAGGIAGKMFTVVNYLGLVCGTLLLASMVWQTGAAWRRYWQAWALAAMLALVAVMEFVLQPLMQELKMASPQGFTPGTPEVARFGMLHGVSSLLYLATSLMGLALAAFGLSRNNPALLAE